MKKRQEAPGELERVRRFVNTLDIERGTEELREPEDLRRWLSEQGLGPGEAPATRADLRRAIELREALRAVLTAHTDGASPPAAVSRTLDELAARARLGLRFDEHGGVRVEPAAAGVDGALGRLLTIVHAAVADGSWSRLKACRDHTCEWAFYDHTKNQSGTWCNMQVCGNRAKARSYRGRRAGAAA
jgi:predicted RNA-binding Zn ribbon-like protein